jgi:hypothetical protein
MKRGDNVETTTDQEDPDMTATGTAITKDTGAASKDADQARSLGTTVKEAADTAAQVATDAIDRSLVVAHSSGAALVDAGHALQEGSDERLSAGTLLSFGLALGLLLGGANRLLVVAALVPAAVMGLTLLDREGTDRRRTS